MLATAADKIKAINSALAKPFLATAEMFKLQGRDLASPESTSRFTATFTRSRREIVKAQRLRYRVFSEEYGATINSPFGLDRDRFDKHCLHLIVRDNESGEVVGYTRILPQEKILRTGGFYSAEEFELTMLSSLQGRVAELGRTCIHPEYRNGAVITVMWSRVAQYMVQENIQYLIGCASVALSEGYDVSAIVERIRQQHLTPADRRVIPKLPLNDLQAVDDAGSAVRMPPLLKAYLRMGSQVCGEPCWDPDFNCLDFFILMSLDNLPRRYVQHFLQPVAV
ncbi:MAG: GNAT family N-acetyltransferase [Alcanivoracaceae bacterium]|nr:GNAT family N-acetyltransferase [Alcanivoracaceae bacterium]